MEEDRKDFVGGGVVSLILGYMLTEKKLMFSSASIWWLTVTTAVKICPTERRHL